MPLTAAQIKAVKKVVEQVTLEGGSVFAFPKLESGGAILADQILSKPPWNELINPWDVLIEIQSVLITERDKVPANYKGPLAALTDKSVIASVEKRVIEFLDSLPKTYYVCFQLQRFPRLLQPVVQLSETVSLIDTGDVVFKDITEPQNSLRRSLRTLLKAESIYAKFLVKGYATPDVDSDGVSRAFAKFKQFIFLGLSIGYIRQKGIADAYADALGTTLQIPNGAVYDLKEPTGEIFNFNFPDQLGEFVRWLSFDERTLLVADASKGVLARMAAPKVPATTAADISTALKEVFRNTTDFLEIPENDGDAERIRAAMEWAVDAYANPNETIAFLQRCIGLESILGEDENRSRGVTDRLSDRYSYLLGSTQSSRVQLKTDFTRVYGLRSDLVHSRKQKISSYAQGAHEASSMLSDVIIKETNSLLKARARKP